MIELGEVEDGVSVAQRAGNVERCEECGHPWVNDEPVHSPDCRYFWLDDEGRNDPEEGVVEEELAGHHPLERCW